MEEAVERYSLSGFDPDGEPHVRRTAEGRLWLCIEFMPPSWDDALHSGPGGLGPWADFGMRLEQAIGVPVVWEDREWFRVDHPREDSIQAIQQFLVAVRQSLDPNAADA